MSADLVSSAYVALVETLGEVDDAGSWAPTGCLGWSVRDLTAHLLEDARRALVALHSPAGSPPDTDRVRYWAGWSNDAAAAANGRRFARVQGSMFGEWSVLRELYAETARAVTHGFGTADPTTVVTTQGHALSVDDLASTLAVEATVHHLDLPGLPDPLDRPGAPGPAGPTPAGLAESRLVLDALAGPSGFPPGWSDTRVVLVGTGRREPSPRDTTELGPVAGLLPLFS